MDRTFWRQGGRLWLQGLLLLALRFWQDRAGFDPDTGLAVPSLPGKLMVGCLVLFAAVELVRAVRLPCKSGAPGAFAPPDKSLMAAVAGCLLLAGGGGLMAATAVTARGWLALAAGIAAVLTAAGLLVLIKKARGGDALSVMPVLPAMLFAVLLVLAVYRPRDCDPLLARIYLPVLAAAMVAYAFYHLAGFLRGDSGARTFVPTADLAVMLSLAAIADGDSLALRLVYGGCALVLTVFLVLRQGTTVQKGKHAAN